MTTEMHPLTLAPARRAELVSGFQAAFFRPAGPVFLRSRANGNWRQPYRPPAGRVLAAAVNLDTVAAVRTNGSRQIRIQSAGYPLCTVDLDRLEPDPREINTTAAFVRGVAARFVQLGCPVAGFDAYVTSTVLPGSGLSSSAAFEVLLGTVLNCLFFGRKLTAPEIAMAGQYGENVFFGKPSGLMDQMACAVGEPGGH